ncbi:conserved hypothetical protein [Aspergillus terreus NIH2624]|uniref:Alcohol dehydrogenase-like C-terminal domain-containing protein n=1 Tax=Aspergillus terreus (strain NIH 2624 / FGSC A1156) TaxID=341663 RepID=Q0CJ25_ASPTN|nr:uncharacterized protein ATEG_06309 [Aspergillus terreus NIH2624]EAU32853.1 conserved hypothetical protein [Aspergillus terreus NIH2624]
MPGGSYAEYALAWAHTTFHLPKETSFEATIPLAGLTAVIALYHHLALPFPWRPATTATPLVIYGGSTAVGAFAIKLARRSNIHPIIAVAGKGASYITPLLDASRGDVVVDYRAGGEATAKGIRAALGAEPLEHVLDTIVSDESTRVLRGVIAPGGNINSVLPQERDVAPGVATNTWVSAAHEAGGPDDCRELCYLFCRWFSRALQRGEFSGHPFEVRPWGLAGVQDALRDLMQGKASAVNLVEKRVLVRRRLDVRGASAAREAPADLRRHGNLHVQMLRERPGEPRVLLEATADQRDIEPLLLEQAVRLLAVRDGAHHRDEQLVADGLLDGNRERRLERGAGLDLLRGVPAAGAEIDQIDGALLDELLREAHRVGEAPALLGQGVLDPVGGGDAQEDGDGRADGVAGGLGDLQRQADAVLEGAAVLVGARVGAGREEAGQQVSVGVVDLDEVRPGGEGALNGGHPGSLELGNVLLGHGLGGGERVGKGDAAGPLDVVRPAADLFGGDGAGAGHPGGDGAGLAAGVGDLDADLLALAVDEVDDAAHGGDLGVLPEADVLGGDAALGQHGGGLDHHQAGAALGDAAQMGDVVVGHVAILGRVLAEGGKAQAVLKGDAADGQRLIELGDGLAAGLWVGGSAGRRRLRGREVGDALCGGDLDVREVHIGVDGIDWDGAEGEKREGWYLWRPYRRL